MRQISIAILTLVTFFASAQTATINLDGKSPGRIFEGFGALSAGASSRLLIDYPEPQRSEILDYLFKPGYGAALQHLKVEVGGDVNSTDGSEPSHMRTRNDHNYTRGYEWWLMEEAVKRNPHIILDILPWGAPGWVGKGHGTLFSQDMADYMADFILGAKKYHNLDIRYVGIWNEKTYDTTYVKMLHKTLVAHHLDTKIVCCDEFPSTKVDQWAIAKDIKSDPELKAAVDVIGAHYPRTKSGELTVTDAARNAGKPIWSSEDQPNPGSGPFVSRDWSNGGRILAHLYNANYIKGRLTKTEIWSPVTSYYDNLAAPNSGLMYANTPWSGSYNVQSTIWVTAHTTQFAQPGWQYLDNSCGALPAKGSYVTFKSPKDSNWSVVLETIGAATPQAVDFHLSGELSSGTVHIWETNSTHTFERIADVPIHNGNFHYSFAPDALFTLTTTTGQHRGSAKPPASSPFPMPYTDGFDKTPLERAARFLSDQNGAFEAHRCLEREGRCLEQVITEKPTPWGPIPDPFTLAGDEKATDYTLAADFHLVDTGDVALMARIDSANVFSDQKALLPSGYVLTIGADGEWMLVSSAFKRPPARLASGTVKLNAKEWHRFSLIVKSNQITAILDDHELASVRDTSHTHGMFAIGTGWNRAQFDNLSVTPAP